MMAVRVHKPNRHIKVVRFGICHEPAAHLVCATRDNRITFIVNEIHSQASRNSPIHIGPNNLHRRLDDSIPRLPTVEAI